MVLNGLKFAQSAKHVRLLSKAQCDQRACLEFALMTEGIRLRLVQINHSHYSSTRHMSNVLRTAERREAINYG